MEQKNMDGYVMEKGEELQDNLLLTFTYPDGIQKEYAVMGMFVADVFQYMALVPTASEDMDIVIVPYEEGRDGSVEFRNFYSDEEYEVAEAAFQDFLAEADEDDYSLNPQDILQENELAPDDFELLL